jgi:hypothetical protein
MTRNEPKYALTSFSIQKKTEHYGSFIRCEHGTKTNFDNMTNYAIPLVILTWHQMIQEYFWKNEKKVVLSIWKLYASKTKVS